MKAAPIFSGVLLGLAVLLVFASAVGVLVMPGAYAKLHFVTRPPWSRRSW